MQNDGSEARTNAHESTEGVPPVGRDNLTESDLRQMIENRNFLLDQYRNLVAHLRPAWQPIETAPREPEAAFLVCAVGDPRGPFVVRSDILWQARKSGTPSHLGLSYLTHWMPLPAPPEPTP